MDIRMIKIDELVPYKNNPRHNDVGVEAVAQSIKEFGFKVPIIIDANSVIVAGHTRMKAAEKLGMTTVPCVVADDLTPEEVRAFRVADNKTAEFSDWDMDLLRLELDGIGDLFTGFEPDEVENILEDIDIDQFFIDRDPASEEKKDESIQCPHCKMFFEP